MALSGLYLLQNVDPAAVGAAPFDIKVVETADDNGKSFTASQVATMQSGGGAVLGYFSLGEAENYRSYFSTLPSSIIGPVDPSWPGNFQVAYWSPEWLSVAESAIADMVKAGYDGIYFDVVDEYELSWAKKNAPNGDSAGAMKALVEELSQYAKRLDPNFQVWVNGGEGLLTDKDYLNAIDGMFKENLYYNWDGSAENSAADIKYTLEYLNIALAAGKPVIDIEYVMGRPNAIANVHEQTAAIGLGSYIGPLDLDYIDYSDNSIGAVTTAPKISAVIETPNGGDLNAGKTVTIALTTTKAVTVNGSPTLTLNNGGTASYNAGKSTATSLVFDYTVAAGAANVAALAVKSVNLPNGATIRDSAGTNANLSLTGLTQSGPEIDTMAPAVINVAEAPSTGTLAIGTTVQITLDASEAVTVNGSPTLSLNDGGTATYNAGKSTTTSLVFDYVVAAGDSNVPKLAVNSVNLPNGATIRDSAGNNANLSLTGLTQSGPQINTTAPQTDSTKPTIQSVVANPAVAVLHAGETATLTVNFSEAVVVNTTGGSPRLTLNDGGVATFAGGSGTNALTFTYKVLAGENTADLTVDELKLNGATIQDLAGNNAVLTGALANPDGILQIDTTSSVSDTTRPKVKSVVADPANAVLHAGDTATLTVNFNEAVIVDTTGGSPRLALNDGGFATYAGGSGTNALQFTYTVAPGESTSDLTVTRLKLNGSTIEDLAGNAAVRRGAVTNPDGILKVDGTVPDPTNIALLRDYIASVFPTSSGSASGSATTVDQSESQQAPWAQPHQSWHR